MMPATDAFDVPGIPEIARYADAQRRARLALVAGDTAEARRHSDDAKRYAQLARVRIASRKERGGR